MFNFHDINDPINNLVTQTKMFLAGYDFDHCQFLLQAHAQNQKTNAAFCLQNRTFRDNELQEILKLVAPFQSKEYLDNYEKWLKDTNIEKNLLSFLEFLAYKGHHRLKTFLKLAHNTNPKPIYWPYYASGAAITAATAGYFTAHPNDFYKTIDWVMYQAPKLTIWLMDYIFLPVNVPRVSLVIKFFTFAYTLRLILANHVTDDAHKIKQMIKHFIENALIMIGQFLCFLNGGILTPLISMLFIASSLSTTLFSAGEFFNLKKPDDEVAEPTEFLAFSELDDAEFAMVKEYISNQYISNQDKDIHALLNGNDKDDVILSKEQYMSLTTIISTFKPEISSKIMQAKNNAQYNLNIEALEAKLYYQRKRKQLIIELVSLCVITAGSIIVILSLMPLPYLNVFFIVFQFFVYQAKSSYFYHQEQSQAKAMQTDVAAEWKKKGSINIEDLDPKKARIVLEAATMFKQRFHPDRSSAALELVSNCPDKHL